MAIETSKDSLHFCKTFQVIKPLVENKIAEKRFLPSLGFESTTLVANAKGRGSNPTEGKNIFLQF